MNKELCIPYSVTFVRAVPISIADEHTTPGLSLATTDEEVGQELWAVCYGYLGTRGHVTWALSIADNLYRVPPDDNRIQNIGSAR
ncbi:hypothetical protein ElyMa_001001200 [Elysia marginata]|uniref:Uncharacterized protein n=1 Tax=Elysia marginata TaxID=1093978 RepID=A0AAV4HIQ0_9GAST|nr:hypothetical protein ElyMa_001001200 [Elysia marginata]